MSILITGGAGFIGHHLAKHLLETSSEELVLIDNLEGITPKTSIENFGSDSSHRRPVWKTCKNSNASGASFRHKTDLFRHHKIL